MAQLPNPMTAAFVRRKVLLLDDDSDLRHAYAFHLEANGFLVAEAETLATALKSFEAVPRCSRSGFPPHGRNSVTTSA